ncbi:MULTISPECIES: glycosyltransferase [unclassified Niallia]|uniref:glycosyltransferase n=1 Tax=unclassified Niallia TaxID=2837522 RepID=UPI0020419FF3|nr:glycosyltransferase [Niallia sp. MER 6]MCM3029700.1 glycosyltransferase [Niallia sp. MER 6]
MNKQTPVFVFKSLNVVRGGLTKAVLTRANTLIKHFEEVIFLTLAFQADYKEIIEELYNSGKLDQRVKVLNFFDDATSNVEGELKVGPESSEVKEEGFYEFIDKDQELPSYRYYKNGKYVKYKRFDSDGKLLFVDYMNEARNRTQRDEYDKEGFLVCSQFMDLNSNIPRLKSYFARNGESYVSVWMDEKTKKEGRTLLYGEQYKEYSSLYKLYTKWVDDKLLTITNPVVFSDSRFSDGLVLDLKTKGIKKVAVLHNNHFAMPYNNKAEIKKTWATFFKGIAKFDRVVFLTHDQKSDVSAAYGDLPSYRVIPHAVPEAKEEESQVTYDPHLAVCLARFETQKRLDEAIKSFKYVVRKIPDAKLHIYGFGPQKTKLEGLIESLGLKENVKLKAFTSNPTLTYKKAACSILTSDYEGFGMIITESMAAGTPVVSYDCKYGPKDIIRDGIDGYVVPRGKQRKLAQRIIKIFKDQEHRNILAGKSLEVKERFSYKNFEKQWIDIIKE